MNAEDIDLNLLTGFAVLLDELSVSRAAARLSVTQPAMSSTLKRLRQLFDDPLLVRASDGMHATEKAMRLKSRVQKVLADIQALLDERDEGESFDPRRVERTIHLGLNDYASLLVMPALMRRLRTQAPGLKVVMQQRKNIETARTDLESGALDFVIGLGRATDLPGSLITRRIFDDPFLTMVRRDHPGVGATLTLDEFLAHEHLVVSPQGHDRGIIDEILAKMGKSRQVRIVVPHFVAAAQLVSESDLVCTIPGRVAELYRTQWGLRTLEPPLALPVSNVTLAWHSLNHHNVVHQWIREQFAAEFNATTP